MNHINANNTFLKTIYNQLLKPGDLVNASHYPQYYGIVYAAIVGVIVNIVLFFAYWFGDVKLLTGLSLSGFILWPLSVYFVRQAKYNLAVYSGTIEMMLHVGVAVYMLGTAYGLQMILWCCIAYVAFDPNQTNFKTRLIAYLCCAEFALLSVLVPLQTNIRPYEQQLEIIFIGSCLAAALPLFIVLIGIKRVQNKLRTKLNRMANVDELTQLLNRASFSLQHEKAHKTFNKYNKYAYCLCLADIDYFKRINDQHGHDVGDQVLVEVSALIQSKCDKKVAVCRWGGEEFALLFPESELCEAKEQLTKIQSKLQQDTLSNAHLSVTISFGLAEIQAQESIESILKRADTLLYNAKQAGRDTIVCSEDSVSMSNCDANRV